VYSALWRVLPGPWWLRVVVLLVLAAAILFALVTWVFPFVDSFIESPNVTVGSS
jgi:hypothetical protein